MIELWRRGLSTAWGYAGVVLATFLIQLLIASGAGFVAAQMLAAAFSRRPYFDAAIDGDVTAWAHLLVAHLDVFRGILWVPLAAAMLWVALSWFLRGGVLRVFAEQPDDRTRTMEAFARGGASNFWSYARLGLMSWILYSSIILPLLGIGISLVQHPLAQTTSLLAWSGYLLLGAAPALAAALLIDTATALASVLLDAAPAGAPRRAWASFALGLSIVFARPRLLLHALTGWLAMLLVAGAYMAISFDKPMLGVKGALVLWFLRTATSGSRHFIKLAMMAGQADALRVVAEAPAPASASA
ncbi:MAG: hypothetical protein IPL79_06390 [Myxococcales bacterium]|nr:hypothetical protein [Myxococcales bacterium]